MKSVFFFFVHKAIEILKKNPMRREFVVWETIYLIKGPYLVKATDIEKMINI